MFKNKKATNQLLTIIIVVGLVLGGLWAFGVFAPKEPIEPADVDDTLPGTQKHCDVTQAITLKNKNTNSFTGATVDSNTETWYADDSVESGEIQTNGLTSVSTTAPQFFSGYVMAGNDNFQSGTDRGTEYYYRKVEFEVKECKAQHTIGDGALELKPEGTITYEFYYQNSLQTTANMTMVAGTANKNGEIKLAVGSSTCVGNPEFDKPLAVCFNMTAGNEANLTKFEPAGTYKVKEISVPGFLKGYNVFGCYQLNTVALCDDGDYKFKLIVEPDSGVNIKTTAYAMILDYTYGFQNEKQIWEGMWGEDLDEGTDVDVGHGAIGNAVVIYLHN